jgi:hypothetical protein
MCPPTRSADAPSALDESDRDPAVAAPDRHATPAGDAPTAPVPAFTEVQRVRDTDLFASLVVTLIPALGAVSLAVWWSAPTDPRALAVLAVVGTAVAGCLAVSYTTRLVVAVDADALRIRVEPFESRPLTVPHTEITGVRVEPDTPTGHGVALGSGRRAWWLDSITYGVGDGECVHVDRTDGRPVHVGSPRAHDLVRALDRATDR